MGRCEACGADDVLLFTCSNCELEYCTDHLPIAAHDCGNPREESGEPWSFHSPVETLISATDRQSATTLRTSARLAALDAWLPSNRVMFLLALLLLVAGLTLGTYAVLDPDFVSLLPS